MLRKIFILCVLCIWTTLCAAQVAHRERVPNIRYSVSGQKTLSNLSNDNVLYTILYFGFCSTPKNGQSVLEANQEYFTLTFSKELEPFFNNFNPDYGRALMVVSSMKYQGRIENSLGVTSYPDIVLIDPDRHILARSDKADEIIDYITTHLLEYATTDWNAYILRALDLLESGQKKEAQKIVKYCISHGRWYDDFSLEAHKAIPLIVASMRHNDEYSFYVGEIKSRYNRGILSEEDVSPFRKEFSRMHVMGDKYQ